jgi:hypothetical protein
MGRSGVPLWQGEHEWPRYMMRLIGAMSLVSLLPNQITMPPKRQKFTHYRVPRGVAMDKAVTNMQLLPRLNASPRQLRSSTIGTPSKISRCLIWNLKGEDEDSLSRREETLSGG